CRLLRLSPLTSFSFSRHRHPPHPPLFPTRRSSDLHSFHKLFAARSARDVRFHRHAIRAHCLQLPQCILRRHFVRTITQRHARPILRQFQRDSASNAACSSRNQRNPVAQRHSLSSPPRLSLQLR